MSEDKNAEANAEKSGGLPIGLMLATAVVALALGAGAAILVQNRIAVEPEEEVAEGEVVAEEPVDLAQDFQERLFPLDPLVVNIVADGYARLLKLTLQLECESVEVRGEVEARESQVRDAVLALVSSKRLADLTDFEGKALLKEELRDRLNQILTTGHVSSVLFTDFVVQ